MEKTWWFSKATEIPNYADANMAHQFYEAIKAVYGPKSYSTHPARTKDGITPIKDKDILSRWEKHLQEPLNQANPVDQSIVDQLPQLPTILELDTLPALEEISAAPNYLKNNKAPGPNGIPADIVKYGGNLLLQKLHSISIAWTSNILPTQWQDANIIMTYKKKDDRVICGNRGVRLVMATSSNVFLTHSSWTLQLTLRQRLLNAFDYDQMNAGSCSETLLAVCVQPPCQVLVCSSLSNLLMRCLDCSVATNFVTESSLANASCHSVSA